MLTTNDIQEFRGLVLSSIRELDAGNVSAVRETLTVMLRKLTDEQVERTEEQDHTTAFVDPRNGVR
jgi:hypothetical protein